MKNENIAYLNISLIQSQESVKGDWVHTKESTNDKNNLNYEN